MNESGRRRASVPAAWAKSGIASKATDSYACWYEGDRWIRLRRRLIDLWAFGAKVLMVDRALEGLWFWPKRVFGLGGSAAKLCGAALVVFAVLMICCRAAFGSSMVMRAPRAGHALPQPAAVETFGGTIKSTSTVIHPGTSLVVVWALNSFDRAMLAQARKNLMAVYHQNRGRSIRLAILHGQSLTINALASEADAERICDSTALPEPSAGGYPVEPADYLQWIDALIHDMGQLGSQWSAVLLEGRLPVPGLAGEAYAESLLERSFAASELRVFKIGTSGSAGWKAVFESSGGAEIESADQLASAMEEASQSFVQVNWPSPALPGGFVVITSEVQDVKGQVIARVPDIVNGNETLPTIKADAEFENQMAEVQSLLSATATDESMRQARALLADGQKLNPLDPRLLRAEILYCELGKAADDAVKAAVLLTQVEPKNGDAWAMLGHAEVLAGDLEKAKAALDRATARNFPTGQLAADRARIDLANKDPNGALAYLLQATRADETRPELWMLQGETAERIENRSLAIQSYEKAVALHESSGQAASSLIRLYVANHDMPKAEQLAAQTVDRMPADFTVRLQFARFLEGENLTAPAKLAWQSLLAVKPRDAESCVRAANAMLKAGNAEAASQLAASGVRDFPKSAELYLVWTDALLAQVRSSEARASLEIGATATNDPVILARLAKMQEGYADRAEETYRKLADLSSKGSSEQHRALKRGYAIAIRDGELETARQFAREIKGADSLSVDLPFKAGAGEDETGFVPGGLEGLATVAHMSSGISPERFFTEYARTLTSHVCRTNCAASPYADEITTYFESIQRLESLGKREGQRVAITMGWNSDEQRRITSETLAMLGLEVENIKGKLTLQHSRRQTGKQDGKQDLEAMLGFDQLGLEDALRAGKPFIFEIGDQPAAIAGGEQRWMDGFGQQDLRNFALLLLKSPAAARLYVGLSNMDSSSRDVLLKSVSLKDLAQNNSDSLAMYSSCFAVEDGHAVVPGGVQAEPVWQHFTGVSPADPAAFFVALLRPVNAELLGYYFHLSQLDEAHQAFFTDSIARASDFEKRFASAQEQEGAHRALTSNSTIVDLLRDLPLDDRGHVIFPASIHLWNSIANSSAIDHTSVDASEDSILLRLSQQHATDATGTTTELAVFLAIVQVDAHRATRLDEESAHLLARRYSDFAPLYPYFMDIRAIDASGFHAFFNLLDRMHKLPLMERNLALGQLYSLIEWDAILSRRRAISDEQAARFFARICDSFVVELASGRTQATMAMIDELLHACGAGMKISAESLDGSSAACLTGRPTGLLTDNSAVADEYRATVATLKAPRLDQVRSIMAEARAILDSPEGLNHVASLAKQVNDLPNVPVPIHVPGIGFQRESLLLYDTAALRRIAGALSRETAAKNERSAAIRKLAEEFLGALEPQVSLSLAAPLYAHFFRSTDLMVSEDPLLLRKHRYFDFGSIAGQNQLVLKSEFVFNSEGAGSYMRGSYAEFGLASAQAASAQMRQGGKGGKAVVTDQIAAIRGAEWDLLTESDLRLAALRILAAREWIVGAADKPAKRRLLEEANLGLLSFARRAEMMQGIEARDWERVWSSVTLPDLFTLGGSKLLPLDASSDLDAWSDSEVQVELKKIRVSKGGQGLDVLARLPFQTEGCYHPHTVMNAPYEEYEGRVDEDDLAERSAEFKLYLAYHADSIGLTPVQTGAIAETLAVKALRVSQMNDYHDWRSLLAAYDSISNKDLTEALGR